MAIDTTLFQAIVPAGSYTAGDKIPMQVVRGPAVVRDGYGEAIMKRIVTLEDGAGQPQGLVHIKNSNWIDEMINFAIPQGGTALADNSPALQRCGDIDLQPNSSWQVDYEIVETMTTTSAFSVFALIDIDYPSVTAVQNPKEQTGAPVTIYNEYNMTTSAYGTALTWADYNVDIFKAGYRYLLAQVGARCPATGAHIGFFSIHGAAGQSGLERIIPFVAGSIGALRYGLDYSTPMVKGPMTLSIAVTASAAGASVSRMELDFIRR